MVSRIGLRNVMCELRTCRMQIAHAGSRTRVTSMGGLYDTATLRALSSAVLLVLCVGVVMVVVGVLVRCVGRARYSCCCLWLWSLSSALQFSDCKVLCVVLLSCCPCTAGKHCTHRGPKPTTTRLRALRSAGWARRAVGATVFPVVRSALDARSGSCRRRRGLLSMVPCVCFEAPPAGLEPAIFGLEVRRLVH